MRWAIAIIKPGYDSLAEKSVRTRYDAFSAYYQRILTGHRSGKDEEVTRPLLPGYLFVRVVPGEAVDMTGFVGVQNFLRYPSKNLKLLRVGFVEELIADCEAGKFDKLPLSRRAKAKEGDSVRPTEGPFAGFMGQLKSVDNDRLRGLLALHIFGRITEIEIKDRDILTLEVVASAPADPAANKAAEQDDETIARLPAA